MKAGDKIVCIDGVPDINSGEFRLDVSYGNVYLIESISENMVWIYDNVGDYHCYEMKRFVDMKGWRSLTIDNILK